MTYSSTYLLAYLLLTCSHTYIKVYFFIFIDGYLWYWVLGFIHIPVIAYAALPDGTMPETLQVSK